VTAAHIATKLAARYGVEDAETLATARYLSLHWGRRARKPHCLTRERFWLGVVVEIMRGVRRG
jgi:hypothetical protein